MDVLRSNIEHAEAATEPEPEDRKVFVTGFEILVVKGTSVARQIMPYLRRYEAETPNAAFHEPNVRQFNSFDENTMYLVEVVTHDPVRAFHALVRWLSAAPWCRGLAGARRHVDNGSNGEPVPFDSDDGRKTLRRQFQNVTELVGPNRARRYNQAYGGQHAA
jgi:hypothetical protein